MKPTGISPSFSRHLGPLLVLLLHQAHLLVANVLTTGSTPLRPPNYITCSSGEYAFGFRALEADPSRFFLGVWFNINLTQEANPAEQKVVWYAKDPGSDSAVNVMALSVLDIIDGYLSLADTSGIIIWKNPNPGMLYGADLVLQDSGNLQFLASRIRLSYTDLSRGRFGLYVQDDNNIVFYLMNLAAGSLALDQYNAYWASNTVTNQTQDGNTTLFFDSPGHLYYQTKNGMVHDEIPPLLNSTISYHQHATLDPDGIVRLYTRPKNATGGRNMSWAVMGQFPTEGCKRGTKLQGLCGINSFCVYGPNDRLDCECPSGYSYVNSQLRYMGCTQGFMPQSCDGKNHSAEFGVVKHPNTNWAKSPYERRLHITEDECASYCLNDCLCAAATYDGTYCSKMVSLAGVGRRGGDVAMDTLIKVRTSSPSVPSLPRRILPYVLLGGSAFLLLSAEPVPGQDGDDSVMLFEWAGQLVGDGRTEVLFHSDDDAIEDLVRVERFLCVALWCIEQNPSLRPTMHQVVQMLEGVVEVDTLPAPTSSNCSSPLTSSVDESPLLSGGATLAIE
ncbi:hypothetical protein ZWY2020_002028 [Hordeum vulgare]|nr:hypothetical protein ZWY2020_002028 [Hordeum vulgare]